VARRIRDDIPERRRTALVIAPPQGGNAEIVRILQQTGFRVTSARNVYDGIAAFMNEPAKLVVLSLEGLRRRDRRALRIFQRRAPEMRVLLLVPEGQRSEVPAFLSAGADFFLPTPVNAREFKLVVRSMLRGDAADSLTGLPNKEAFERAFERERSRAKRVDGSLALAILDLDDFGMLNASYGFLVADRVLCEVADRLSDSIRSTDIVTRWGGDEFVAQLTQLPHGLDAARKEVRKVLERARDAVRRPIHVDGHTLTVTLSGGVAIGPHEGDSREELFNIANVRLQDAKLRGKDRVVYGGESDTDEESDDAPGPGTEEETGNEESGAA